jgi:hypothetical protein
MAQTRLVSTLSRATFYPRFIRDFPLVMASNSRCVILCPLAAAAPISPPLDDSYFQDVTFCLLSSTTPIFTPLEVSCSHVLHGAFGRFLTAPPPPILARLSTHSTTPFLVALEISILGRPLKASRLLACASFSLCSADLGRPAKASRDLWPAGAFLPRWRSSCPRRLPLSLWSTISFIARCLPPILAPPDVFSDARRRPRTLRLRRLLFSLCSTIPFLTALEIS